MEGIKERLKVLIEKLRIVAATVVVLTGGLIGFYNRVDSVVDLCVFSLGFFIFIVLIVYLIKINHNIEEHLKKLDNE